METRKLIKFGKNSFVVSLPKDWVKSNKLAKGSTLFLEQKPGSVVLTSTKVQIDERIGRVNCDNKSISALQTEITSLYMAGCTQLVMEGKKLAEVASELRDLIHDLAGAEVIEQSLNRIVVRDLIDIKQVALGTLINRMDMMVRSMFQDTLSEQGVDGAVLRDRDRDLNRLHLLVSRVTRRVLEKPSVGNLLGVAPNEAHYYDKISWALERIGDYLKRVAGDMERANKPLQKRLRKRLDEAYKYYLSTTKSYYNRTTDRALVLHEEIVQLLVQYTKHVYGARNPDEVIALENIKNVLRDLRIVLRATVELVRKTDAA